MTIVHHPSDETLTAFASGTLDEARALVVATHISLCPHCRKSLAAFEEVGGALLDAAPAASMSAGAMERTLQRALDQGPSIRSHGSPALFVSSRPNYGPAALLEPYAMGSWRRIGPGIQFRPVDVASDATAGKDAVRVFMLKATPGTRLPRHRHTGTEWTCVFEGAFRHQIGRYGPGDFDEADENDEHQPVVEDGAPCICLVGLQGTILLQSRLGRLIQPFLRI